MRRFLLVMIAGMLGGCIPAPYGPYYRPSYPDASSKLSKAWCGGQAGPPAKLDFQGPEGMRVSVNAGRDYGESERIGPAIHILLRLPTNSRFRFLSDRIEVATKANESGAILEPELLVISSVDLPADAWVDFRKFGAISPDSAAGNRQRSLNGRFGSVRFPIGELDGRAPPALRMELPSIEVAREPILTWPIAEMQAIAPRKGDWTTRYRTSAYQDQLQEKFEACRKSTPQRHCDAIPLLEPYGFKYENGDFLVTGRLWSYQGKEEPGVRYEVEMEFGAIQPWRLSAREIRFVAPIDGNKQNHGIATMHVVWRHQVPLSTPVRVNTEGGRPETLLRIDTTLSQTDASRFHVRLPSFELNGRQYEFQPIELERRLFDGGLEPFNC